jgi:hypothetical protein
VVAALVPPQDLAPATLETYAQQYRRHVHPCFGDRAFAEITALDLAGFARRLRAQGLAPSTVTMVLSVIRRRADPRRSRCAAAAQRRRCAAPVDIPASKNFEFQVMHDTGREPGLLHTAFRFCYA